MAQRVVDHGDLRKYRTEIPNIVLTLGLSPYELALYVHLKRTAGANSDGVCWKSTATLAKESGMSGGMVSKAKAGLQREFVVLGKPLITVTEEANIKGGKPKHCITLTDIWTQNFKYKGASSQSEVGPLSRSYSEHASSPHEIASSPHEIKKEPLEEETLEEEKERDRSHLPKVGDPPFQSHAFTAALVEYEQHRLEKKSRLTPTARRNLYKKLERIGEQRAIAALEYSVVQGYTGVFEEHENGKSRYESSTERNARNLRENVAYIRSLENSGSEADRQDPVGLLTSGVRHTGTRGGG